MDGNDYVLLLHNSSESGYTQRRMLIPVSEIIALEEESVPIKGKSRTRIYLKHTSRFTTSEPFDEICHLISSAFKGEQDNAD